MRFEAVICAAGGGTRMGKNKALCQLSSDETFLSSIVSSIRSISHDAPIAVVIGAQAEEVKSIHRSLCDDPNLFWVENLSWQSTHMLDSLMLGLYALPRHCIALHWPVDWHRARRHRPPHQSPRRPLRRLVVPRHAWASAANQRK